jgi:hypothetical protein
MFSVSENIILFENNVIVDITHSDEIILEKVAQNEI